MLLSGCCLSTLNSGCLHPLDRKERRAGGREEGSVWEDGGCAQRCLTPDCRSVAVFSHLHGEDGANPRTRAGHGP